MIRTAQITTVILVAMLFAIPLVSAWEHKVDIWTDFDQTKYKDATNDIRYDETTTYFSAPRSVRLRNWAAGWVEIDDEGTVGVTFRLRFRDANSHFFVGFYTEKDNKKTLAVDFGINQESSERATISIRDRRDPAGDHWEMREMDINFFAGKWSLVWIKIGYIDGLPQASMFSTNEDGVKMQIERIMLHVDGTVAITKTFFDWIEFATADCYSYIDDLKVSTDEDSGGWVDDLPVNPVIHIPGTDTTVGGAGGALILTGFIAILLGSAYYFNLMPLPSYKKGRIRMRRRRA